MKKLVFVISLMVMCSYCVAQNTKSIIVKKAGTLAQMLTDEEKATVDELMIEGKLNSADVKILRRMAGYDGDMAEFSWQGQLKKLDLSKATFVDDDTPYLKVPLNEKYKIRRTVSEQVRLVNYRTGQKMSVNRDQYKENMGNSRNIKNVMKANEMMSSGKHGYVLSKIDDKDWLDIKRNRWNIRDDQWVDREKGDTTVYYMYCHTAKKYFSAHLFYQCKNLKEIIMNDKTEFISYHALSECPALEVIRIPKDVVKINSGAFSNLPGLKKVYISKDTEIKELTYDTADIKARFFKESPDMVVERY